MIDLTTTDDREAQKLSVSAMDEEPFFTDFDLEVLDSLRHCYNQPKELVRIAMPAVFSLALCPLTLFMFDPFRKFIWPDSQLTGMPDINDAIACYLSPAGLVYATSFGFAFQQVRKDLQRTRTVVRARTHANARTHTHTHTHARTHARTHAPLDQAGSQAEV